MAKRNVANGTMIRQGDVLLVKVEKMPKGKAVPLDGGRVILAYGEVTGHSHSIAGEKATLFECVDETSKKTERFLEVKEGGAELQHQEHDAHWLQEGTYEVRQQNEYHPEEIRKVRD